VDKSRDAVKIIEENAKKTRLFDKTTIIQSDYLDFIRRNSDKKFDIIILDPPYAKGFYIPALKAMLDADMIKPSSIIVCESGAEEIFGDEIDLKSRFSILKQTKYASTYITLLNLTKEDNDD
jgi:16S rRNA (guanine966-N2)-methyltransferase